MTVPNAKFALSALYADSKILPPTRPCPFGKRVVIQFLEISPGFVNKWYKVEVTNLSTGIVNVLTEPFSEPLYVQNTLADWHPVTRSGDYYLFQSFDDNHARVIQRWDSTDDNLYNVKITFRDGPSDAASWIATISHRIQLDNTKPTVHIQMDPIAGSPGDCRDTSEGDPPITGTFIANDSHFGYWTMSTLPNTTMTPSNQPKAPGLNNYQPAPAPSGHAWELATSGPSPADPLAFQMNPCGYVVHLHVWDLSILNSSPGSHNENETDVGFCLRKKEIKP